MKHLAQKLKSRRGASMLFALLVFLLCLLAGVTALTAAAANAGRYSHLEEEQQQYFSVASALGLLQDDLETLADASDGPFTVTATCKETQSWWYTYNASTGYTLHMDPDPDPKRTITLKYPAPSTPLNYFQYLLLQNSLPAEWQGAIDDLFSSSTIPSPPSEQNFTINLEPDDPELTGTVKPVNVKVDSSGGYTLEMELSTEGSNAYPLKVVWSGTADVETTTETKTTGGPAPAPPPGLGATSSGTRTTTITLTCTLRWPAENRVVTFG